MEGHKEAICAYEAEPEMNSSQGLIHHSPSHFGEPEVSCSKDAEHGRDPHHHVEMADHKVSRMEHDIDGRLRQKKTTNTAADEHRNKAQSEQGSRRDAQLRAVKTKDPDQHRDGGWD